MWLLLFYFVFVARLYVFTHKKGVYLVEHCVLRTKPQSKLSLQTSLSRPTPSSEKRAVKAL